MGIHSATNVRKLAHTYTRVAVWRESNQLVISSLAWRNISFFVHGELGLVAFFDEREVRPQPEPVP